MVFDKEHVARRIRFRRARHRASDSVSDSELLEHLDDRREGFDDVIHSVPGRTVGLARRGRSHTAERPNASALRARTPTASARAVPRARGRSPFDSSIVSAERAAPGRSCAGARSARARPRRTCQTAPFPLVSSTLSRAASISSISQRRCSAASWARAEPSSLPSVSSRRPCHFALARCPSDRTTTRRRSGRSQVKDARG